MYVFTTVYLNITRYNSLTQYTLYYAFQIFIFPVNSDFKDDDETLAKMISSF